MAKAMALLAQCADTCRTAVLVACGLLAVTCWVQSLRELRRSAYLTDPIAALPGHLITRVTWSEAQAREPLASSGDASYKLHSSAQVLLSTPAVPTSLSSHLGFDKSIATALWRGSATACLFDEHKASAR